MSYRSSQDPEENLPDWLKALRKRQPPEPASEDKAESPTANRSDKDEPDWLQSVRERYGHSDKSSEPGDYPEPEESALSDTQPITPKGTIETPIGTGESVPASEEPPGGDISDDHQSPETEANEDKAEFSLGETTKREFPDWLEEFGNLEDTSEEIETASHIPAFTDGTEPELAPGEMPNWLEALRPDGALTQKDTHPEESLLKSNEAAGPLAGLSGILPAEPEAIESKKPPVYSTRLELNDSQSQHVASLRKLIEDEGKPKEDLSRAAASPARWMNLIMTSALFAAILIPLISQSQTAPLPEPELAPESAAVFEIIESLPSEAPVLIGMDLQPALFGETKAVVTAVLDHLLDRQAHLVFVSTQPTGPGLAEHLVLKELAKKDVVATSDYTNLGYLSGGMAALRSFLSDPRGTTVSMTALGLNPWESSALEPVGSISDFSLVVIVSGNAGDVRLWIEQGSAEMPNGLVAVTSAQAGPLLLPYLQNEPQTLRGLVSGVQGGVIYERMRAQEDGDGRAWWDAYSMGSGAIFLLILFGGLYGRLIHMQPNSIEGKSPKDETRQTASQRGN